MKSAIAFTSVAAVSGVNRLSFLADRKAVSLEQGPATIFDHVFINNQVVFNLDPEGPLGAKGSTPQFVCQEQMVDEVLDSVKVCGVNMQVTIFKNHGCEKGEIGDTAKVGTCNTAMEQQACIQIDSPEEGHDNIWIRRARSYVLHPCDADLAKEIKHAAPGAGKGDGDKDGGEGGDGASAEDKEGAEEMMDEAKAEVAADEADAAVVDEPVADAGAAAAAEEEAGGDEEIVPAGGPIEGGLRVVLPSPPPVEEDDEEAKKALEESQKALEEEAKEEAKVPAPVIASPPGTGGQGVNQFNFHVGVNHLHNFVKKAFGFFRR